LRIGRSTCRNILGLFSFGDGSINKALVDGGITKIHYIDKHVTSVLIFMTEQETIIYGE
jgi:hypothetical protein